MKLRERQMHQRRNRILDAAERLIRETGGTDFSVRVLAEVAEVAPATPFNLFGSKEGLLYALLSRNLEEIISKGLDFKAKDPVLRVVEAATNAVGMFASDPTFMRPLYQVLLGVSDLVHRPQFMERSLTYWRTAIEEIPPQGGLKTAREREFLVHAIQAQFLGLMEYWVHHDLDDEGFREYAIYGVLISTMSLLDEKGRASMTPLLAKTMKRMPGVRIGAGRAD